jgi:hypothetical protein
MGSGVGVKVGGAVGVRVAVEPTAGEAPEHPTRNTSKPLTKRSKKKRGRVMLSIEAYPFSETK